MQNLRPARRSRSFPNVRFHPRAIALVIIAMIGVGGCGGSSTSSPTPTPPPPLLSVTIRPDSVTVVRGATQSFAATVTGTTNTAVTWSVQENLGGTIDSAGLYTAPQDTDGTFHVVATSQANSAAKGIAAAVVVAQPQLTISPVTVTLIPGGTQAFTAAVAGLANSGVTWTIQETGGGLISGAGLYTAPNAVGFYHLVATSVEDTTVIARSTITVTTSSGGFTPTGGLQKARTFHTATLLANGKVLVAGGTNSPSDTDCIDAIVSTELYDPAAGSFAPTGALTAARYLHTATSLPNGKVLVAGGFGEASNCPFADVQAQNTAELYDPVAGSFNRTGDMTAIRGGHTATLLMNGKVLVAGGDQPGGGRGLTDAELYDPSTEAFTQTGDLLVARFRHTATLLKNGKVLIVGGLQLNTPNAISTAEVYDPATGSFTVTGSMVMAREEHTATLLADGKVLIVGGESTVPGSSDLRVTATAEVYDPSTGLFSTTGSMSEARNSHTATLLASGNVLIAGGGDDNSTAELYNPTTSSFSITGGMEVGRSGHSATLLQTDIVGGIVLVVGGGSFVPIATAELFFEDGNFWDY
jgi:Bacterial Ig-like domain (group 2)/Galactose oxidase, central domain